MAELTALRSELSEDDPTDTQVPLGAENTPPFALLERLDALEAELRTLTGRLERQSFEVNQRLSAAEARLNSLADVLEEKDGLGPVTPPDAENDAFPERQEQSIQLTAQEQADFDRIENLFGAQEYEAAIRRADQFVISYPGGPLTLQVMLKKAQAYEALENWEAAADAYLTLFNESGEQDIGSRALFGLAQSFERLDRPEDACRSYAQIGQLYPSSAMVVPANSAQKDLNCII